MLADRHGVTKKRLAGQLYSAEKVSAMGILRKSLDFCARDELSAMRTLAGTKIALKKLSFARQLP